MELTVADFLRQMTTTRRPQWHAPKGQQYNKTHLKDYTYLSHELMILFDQVSNS
jgi:hypothetical protein